jgi:KUP system potassium uptake protein
MSNSTSFALNAQTKVAGEVRARVAERPNLTTILLALGIVYGDLGTSPLYTLQTIVHFMGDQFTPEAALGSLSLVFWSLIITISVKYSLFVMRADNHGEGGILALMAMTGAHWSGRGRWLVIFGLFGAALIYGDGIITPAISVLSAGIVRHPQVLGALNPIHGLRLLGPPRTEKPKRPYANHRQLC